MRPSCLEAGGTKDAHDGGAAEPMPLGAPPRGASPWPTLKSVRKTANLRRALAEINPRVVGIDGLPLDAFLWPRDYYRWDPNVLDLYPDSDPLAAIQESLTYRYQPDPTQSFLIKKRLIERGTIANAIVERAIGRKLGRALDASFQDCCWGFRPGRSPELAILQVRRLIRQGSHFSLKTDIRHFFDSIDRERLRRLLEDWIPDAGLREAIMSATSPVVISPDGPRERLVGLPQGNGLSPLLSNIYLAEFDRSCSHLYLFRYVDDLLVLGRSETEVHEALIFTGGSLARLGLHLHDKKTKICDLYKTPIVFLGYEFRGGNVLPPQEAIDRLAKGLKVRGHKERTQLLKTFARRYKIGPVRKFFRRLDRYLSRLYPPGTTLVGLLETEWTKSARSKRNESE
jgi:hypothetical protein